MAVAFWTVLTSLFLLLRLGMGGYVRLTQGPLRSWFADVAEGLGRESLAARIFTKRERLP